MIVVVLVLILSVAAIGFFHCVKGLPEGLNLRGPDRVVDPGDIEFFADITASRESTGERWVRREIFEEVMRRIGEAESMVVADFFLINEFAGASVEVAEGEKSLSRRFVEALANATRRNPSMPVILITDPINTVYGGREQPLFDLLRQSGVEVVLTDIRQLRDSNRVYSPLWRTFIEWWGGGSPKGEMLDNPLGEGKVGISAVLELLNFKANHRKVLITGDGDHRLHGLVTSANPHSASAFHGNVALGFEGPLAVDLLRSEEAVYRFSTGRNFPRSIRRFLEPQPHAAGDENSLEAVVLTEKAIKVELLDRIDRMEAGDEADIAMFYFSDFDLRNALARAVRRGATVRLLLDPNKDAFGREKNGIPNRQVGTWLAQQGVEVRWYRTGGEQFHTKMALFRYGEVEGTLVLGSANWTRRNLNNLNLETCVSVTGSLRAPVFVEAERYFSFVWSNNFLRGREGIPQDLRTSLPHGAYRDTSWWTRTL